ncbi:helix-turn-helix transcriptional regulator [Stappia sp. ES.058]|uniref:helix-turn-helix domain-containing protein n=1 Tax=Stappia sp. ES.058 TaxID=1881061 RepID=UPI000B87965E
MEHPLKTYRTKSGLTLETLASLSNSTAATLSRIEARKQSPSLMLVQRLVLATGGCLSANDFVEPPQASVVPPLEANAS